MVTKMMSGGHESMRSTRPKRANAKSQAPKKPPQRGLGVAQLERLRLQERLNKMTGTNPEFNYLNAALDPSPALAGGTGIPLTTPGYSAPPTTNHHQLIGSGGSAGCFFPTAPGIPTRGLEGIPPSAGYGGEGYFGNLPIQHGEVVVPGRVVSSPFGIGGPDLRIFHQQGVCSLATSRELSSRPNGHCPVESCEFCIKKKRIDEQNMDFNRSLRNIVSYPETTKINNNIIGHDYIGLSHPKQDHFLSNNGLNLNARDSTSAFKTYRSPNQVVEVEGGAHNKMNNGGSSTGTASKEHEFFGRSASSKGQIFPAVGVVALNPEEASNSIDLTLKL